MGAALAQGSRRKARGVSKAKRKKPAATAKRKKSAARPRRKPADEPGRGMAPATVATDMKMAKPRNLGPNTLGCCNIEYDDKPEDQIPNITQARCKALAQQRGGTPQWVAGACAES
jgi:hypothetical protein